MDTISVNSLEDIRYVRVVTTAEFDEVCRLRYQAYYSNGLIVKSGREYFDDLYDQQPNAVNFALNVSGCLAGALRLVYFDPGKPSLSTLAREAFADVLQTPTLSSKRLIDSNRFVVNRDLVGDSRLVATAAVKLALTAGHLWQVDYGTATVRPAHYAFYRRYIYAEEWASPRPYPTLSAELGLLMCDFKKHQAKFINRFGELGKLSATDRAQFPDFHF